jgi:hypothetical protein
MEQQLKRLRMAEQRMKVQLKEATERVRLTSARAREKAARALEVERRRADDRLRRHQDASRKLRSRIEDLERRLKLGETAQSEGLLEERALVAFLKDEFRGDLFEHVGKGGDILHDICTDGGTKVGRIVYEIKRVQSWSNAHVLQCAEAQVSREADLAILVTNRFPARKQHYFVERGVLIISPIAVVPLVHTAREGLLRAYGLRTSADRKKRAVQAVYDYLAAGEYAAHIRRVAQHFTDLEVLFRKEVQAHRRTWDGRVKLYHGIAANVAAVDERLRRLLGPVEGPLTLPEAPKNLIPRFSRDSSED